MFVCPPGQVLSGSNSSTCMENVEWEPDPREVECTGAAVATTTSVVTTTIGTTTCHVMMYNASMPELIIIVYVVFTRPIFTENMFIFICIDSMQQSILHTLDK